MEKKNKTGDILVIGFALFAMFFGSGNLIFPSYLGRLVGNYYIAGLIGFMITGIGLPLLSVMASAKAGGEFSSITSHVGKTFSVVLLSALVLTIGPFLAIPRTAATTFEIGIRPFFPHFNSLVAIIIYFAINLAFVLKPSSIVDIIGKFLTPILIAILLVLIIKGIVIPIGPKITEHSMENVFATSILEGYQTMDALGAVCFGSIIVKSIKAKGYSSTKDCINMALRSSLVAVIGLGVIYGGLMYLGTHTGNLQGEIEKTALISTISREILGSAGSVFLAIAVAVACLTTSIGLTMTVGNYFSDLTNNKISYQTVTIITTIVSILVASLGVDTIIGVTGPILNILYPIIIVFVLISLVEKTPTNLVYQIPVYTTLVIVLVDECSKILNMSSVQRIVGLLPLSSYGFAWIIPAIIAYIIGKVIKPKRGTKTVLE